MTTKLFQAVSKLSAKYRWCLTGTPIQNSLEDLASLIAFIQIPSLDNLVDFRKHIVTPLLNGAHQGLENIRILLDSVCLHRTKKLLNLPGVVYQDRHIDFSTAEMLQYNETQKEMVSAVRKHDSHSRNLKGYFGIFQLQLQLRRYCNHGTYQKPSSQAADIQFEPEEAFALLKKKRDAKCTICRIHITGVSGLEDKVSGCFTACGHLICLECIPRFEKTLRNDSGSRQCSLCLLKLPENYLVGNEDGPQTFEKSSVVTSKYFRDQGMSSKVARLLKDIKESKEEGKR
jgi:SWI/SNF-related matrix-associated actin-dependent regulator of chromatin subfamily A3